MPDNDFINSIGAEYDEGNSDPYIPTRFAQEAIEADYPAWEQAVNDGSADWESASLMAAFGVDSPYTVNSIDIEYDGSNWTLNIDTNTELHEIDLGADLPDWVFDWFYDMADEFGWDWEVTYGD